MTKKTWIRIWIVIAIICLMGFSDRSFAAEGLEHTGTKIFGITLSYIVSVLSWLWIFFANIAWEFLTNKRVYGEGFWLDVLLRKYWNVIKNFANFWLWFYFIYVILKWLIWTWKNSIEQTLKNNLLWLVIAWIWIQASRFVTAFFIDLSTVTLAAAGSFPSAVVSSSPAAEESLKRSLNKAFDISNAELTWWDDVQIQKVKEISLFSKDSKVSEFLNVFTGRVQLNTWLSYSNMIDKILPSANNVSGPLYFMWLSILDTTNINTIDQTNIKATIYNTIIQWWTTIIYAIEMLVLCVIALIRILYLWMFIVLSPIAVLLRCIQQSWQKIWWENKWLNKIISNIKFDTFLINVFKPTIVVLWLWIAVIFTSLMTNIIQSSANSNEGTFDFGAVKFSSRKDPSTLGESAGDTTYTTTMSHDLFSFTLSHVWKPFLELIISILTIILVYQIIKIAVKMWNWDDFVWKSINSLQEWVWDILWKTPVIPVSGYDEKGQPTTHFLSAGSILKVNSSGEVESALLSKKIASYQSRVDKKITEQEKIVSSWFGDNNKTQALPKWDKDKIKTDIESQISNWTLSGLGILTEYKKQITDMGNRSADQWWLEKDYWYGMKLDTYGGDDRRYKRFKDWLNSQKTPITSWTNFKVWEEMRKRWHDPNIQNKTIEGLFTSTEIQVSQADRVKAYAELFGIPGNITTWEQLKKADFSVK